MEKSYMLINCEMGDEQFLYSQLMKKQFLTSGLVTFGSYDVVAEFETGTQLQMNEVIATKIRKLEVL